MSTPEPHRVVTHPPAFTDDATLQDLAFLSTQGVLPDACLDCDGVAVVRPVESGYTVHTFHRDTCPIGQAAVREDDAGQQEGPA